MTIDWSLLANHFDASDETLLRSNHSTVVLEHIKHYECRMLRFMQDQMFQRILDIGCGDGKILYEYACKYKDKEFIGIDLSEKNIQVATSKYSLPNVEYRIANAADSLEGIGSVDLIFSFSVIQYFDIASSLKLAENIQSILSDNGCVVHMSIPDDRHIFRSYVPNKVTTISLAKLCLRFLLLNVLGSRSFGDNGVWWSRSDLEKHYLKYFSNVNSFSSDSWYRFDLIARK